jgi:hypothetical protein
MATKQLVIFVNTKINYMRKFNFKTILSVGLLAGVMLTSCTEETSEIPVGFSQGVLVVNEGAFGQSNGTISHIDRTNGEVTQDLFGLANGGVLTGDVVQSVAFHDTLAFVVVNNSNKIEVVSRRTFISVATIEDLALPRYMVVYEGKGYLTEWVAFGQNGRISRINLDNYSVEASLTLGQLPDRVAVFGNSLWVANSSESGLGGLVQINPTTFTIQNSYNAGDRPGGLMVIGDKLWVLAGGNPSWTGNQTAARLSRYASDGTQEVSLTLPLEQGNPFRITGSASQGLFYAAEGGIYKLALSNPEIPANPFILQDDIYGMAIDPQSGNLYAAVASSFTANGQVRVFNPASGAQIAAYTVGIGPNGFGFQP